jgi:hypothetical protein
LTAAANVENQKKIENSQMRLWIQWFSCTWCPWATPYVDAKFKKQTRAIYDIWGNSFWVWNSGSNYYKSWYK